MSDENKNDAIDLGSEGDDFDPFAKDDELTADDESDNPFENAINAAKTKDMEKSRQSLYEKPPVFDYAGATEDIADSSQTFDELRISKAADFPELEDGKRVSWTVEYGKITKTVTDTKGTSIAKMKTDIEASKEFLDALKKAKDKSPACKIKPKVTAQSKGAESYKGVFINEEEAATSGKLITFFPAKDGNVYEMRNTPMGRFITEAADNSILHEVRVGFTPALPPIPQKHLHDIISFFKLMAKNGNNEALANIYWDKQEEVFITDIPQQSVSRLSVKSEINPAYDNARYIHYMDIHSHNTMRAFFSSTDDADEKATRVYAVVGNVLSYFPEIKVRISNGGKFLEIEPSVVFDKFRMEDFKWRIKRQIKRMFPTAYSTQ
ncbi:MAG: hypothetical protein FWG87_01555 [Defluviitaleaceae bacterium]|nr:hypothetical protein [Defluviitaleaceae bacterium]